MQDSQHLHEQCRNKKPHFVALSTRETAKVQKCMWNDGKASFVGLHSIARRKSKEFILSRLLGFFSFWISQYFIIFIQVSRSYCLALLHFTEFNYPDMNLKLKKIMAFQFYHVVRDSLVEMKFSMV